VAVVAAVVAIVLGAGKGLAATIATAAIYILVSF